MGTQTRSDLGAGRPAGCGDDGWVRLGADLFFSWVFTTSLGNTDMPTSKVPGLSLCMLVLSVLLIGIAKEYRIPKWTSH